MNASSRNHRSWRNECRRAMERRAKGLIFALHQDYFLLLFFAGGGGREGGDRYTRTRVESPSICKTKFDLLTKANPTIIPMTDHIELSILYIRFKSNTDKSVNLEFNVISVSMTNNTNTNICRALILTFDIRTRFKNN